MKIAAALAAAAVTVGALTACGSDNRDNTRYADTVCVDRITNIRVDDWRCDGINPAYAPWYLTAGQAAFGYGQRAPYGSAVLPQGYQQRSTTRATSPARTTAPATTTAKPGTSSKPAQTTKAPAPSKQKTQATVKAPKPVQKPATRPR